jgi:hypothetical protein
MIEAVDEREQAVGPIMRVSDFSCLGQWTGEIKLEGEHRRDFVYENCCFLLVLFASSGPLARVQRANGIAY